MGESVHHEAIPKEVRSLEVLQLGFLLRLLFLLFRERLVARMRSFPLPHRDATQRGMTRRAAIIRLIWRRAGLRSIFSSKLDLDALVRDRKARRHWYCSPGCRCRQRSQSCQDCQMHQQEMSVPNTDIKTM
jgi:hypothetical protein